MKPRISKPALFLIALLAIGRPVLAQDTTSDKEFDSKAFNKSMQSLNMSLKDLNKDLNASLKDLNKDLNLNLNLNLALNNLNKGLNSELNLNLNKELNASLKNLNNTLNLNLNAALIDLSSDLNLNLKDLDNNMRSNVNLSDADIEKRVAKGEIQEKVKNYSKSYPADGNDKLEISNKFGKVTVNTWNKNEFKVDIQIKGIADDDETAQKLVDNTAISDGKSGDVVSFKTIFGNNSSSIWNNLFNNRNDHHRIEVNYTIYMPAKNDLDVDNKYGATELPDLDGKVTINSAYGSLVAKTLSHADNVIRVRYGSANIDALTSCQIDMGYGSLDLDAVDKLTGRFSYGSVKIGKIKTSADIDAHYAGGVQIDNLDKNFTSFAVNASYSSVKVGVSNASNADFDITVHYGGFDYGDLPVNITEKSPSDDSKGFHPTHNYKGHIGKGSSGSTISIRSSYGGVKFE